MTTERTAARRHVGVVRVVVGHPSEVPLPWVASMLESESGR